MAATKSQGKSFSLFIVGVTVAAAGLATIGAGGGKIALVIGLVLTGLSFAGMFKTKAEEGAPALGPQPAVMKLLGLVLAVGGWLVVLLGLHVTSGVSARLIVTLVGLILSLVGIIGILPVAANKDAIWKG